MTLPQQWDICRRSSRKCRTHRTKMHIDCMIGDSDMLGSSVIVFLSIVCCPTVAIDVENYSYPHVRILLPGTTTSSTLQEARGVAETPTEDVTDTPAQGRCLVQPRFKIILSRRRTQTTLLRTLRKICSLPGATRGDNADSHQNDLRYVTW